VISSEDEPRGRFHRVDSQIFALNSATNDLTDIFIRLLGLCRRRPHTFGLSPPFSKLPHLLSPLIYYQPPHPGRRRAAFAIVEAAAASGRFAPSPSCSRQDPPLLHHGHARTFFFFFFARSSCPPASPHIDIFRGSLIRYPIPCPYDLTKSLLCLIGPQDHIPSKRPCFACFTSILLYHVADTFRPDFPLHGCYL